MAETGSSSRGAVLGRPLHICWAGRGFGGRRGGGGVDYSSYLHLGSGGVLDFAVPAAETAINKAALPSSPGLLINCCGCFDWGRVGLIHSRAIHPLIRSSVYPSLFPSIHSSVSRQADTRTRANAHQRAFLIENTFHMRFQRHRFSFIFQY